MKKMKKIKYALVVLGCLFISSEVLAALPALVAPSTAPADGDWLATIKGYVKDGGLVIGLILSVAGFLWLGWNALSDLNEVRTGKKEWGAAGLGTVGGAAIFLWVSYLLSKATNVI